MDLRWQLIASLLRRGSQSINLGQWFNLMSLVCFNTVVALLPRTNERSLERRTVKDGH